MKNQMMESIERTVPESQIACATLTKKNHGTWSHQKVASLNRLKKYSPVSHNTSVPLPPLALQE